MTQLDIRPAAPAEEAPEAPIVRVRARPSPSHSSRTTSRRVRARAARGGEPTAPAGRALAVILYALALALVFNSKAAVHAGEGMRPGVTRTLVLTVARPLDRAVSALSLDRPRRGLDRLLGRAGRPGAPPLLTSAKHRPATAPAPPAVLRRPTPAEPLRLVVTGDSMVEFLGPALLRRGAAIGPMQGDTVVHYGTGLVRPDFFDWSVAAQRLVRERAPEAVVVMMGGNDGQGIRLADGTVLRDGTARWGREYQRRAQVVMRTLTRGAERVYWLGMPVARSPRLARDYAVLNAAVQRAAGSVPGVRFVDLAARLSVHGRYQDYLRTEDGRIVLARAHDGIHLSRDGAAIAARLALEAVDADWHLSAGG